MANHWTLIIETFIHLMKGEEEKMNNISHSSSIFDSVEFSPYDDAYKVLAAFADDSHPDKVSLGAGVYRDDDAQPWTLSSVKKVICLTVSVGVQGLMIRKGNSSSSRQP